jgi:hypothetical protein
MQPRCKSTPIIRDEILTSTVKTFDNAKDALAAMFFLFERRQRPDHCADDCIVMDSR